MYTKNINLLNFFVLVSPNISKICYLLQILTVTRDFEDSTSAVYKHFTGKKHSLPVTFRAMTPKWHPGCTSRMYILDVHPGCNIQDVHPGCTSRVYIQDIHPGRLDKLQLVQAPHPGYTSWLSLAEQHKVLPSIKYQSWIGLHPKIQSGIGSTPQDPVRDS